MLKVILIKFLRRVFKLILARWHSQPMKYQVRDLEPITERLQSISLKSCLSKFCTGKYLSQWYKKCLIGNKLLQYVHNLFSNSSVIIMSVLAYCNNETFCSFFLPNRVFLLGNDILDWDFHGMAGNIPGIGRFYFW